MNSQQSIGSINIPNQGEVFIYPDGKMYLKSADTGEWSFYGRTSSPESTLQKYKERYDHDC